MSKITTLRFSDKDYNKLKQLIKSGRYRTMVDAISDLIRKEKVD